MQIVLFRKRQKDYSCLLRPLGNEENLPEVVVYSGSYSPVALPELVEFVNFNCGTFRTLSGEISPEGVLNRKILNDLSQRKHLQTDHALNMRYFYSDQARNPFKRPIAVGRSTDEIDILKKQCRLDDTDMNNSADDKCTKGSDDKYTASLNSDENSLLISECDKVDLLDWKTFFRENLLKSKPVIIKGGAKDWPAMKKWTNEFILKNVGTRKVHVKVADHGRFEGCENGSMWEGFEKFSIPSQVKEKLPYRDLVVVRPAPMSFKFDEFFKFMTSDIPKKDNVSAYIEYASLRGYMPNLVDDIMEMPFVKDNLPKDQFLEHLNVWLSDGNTLGKLHFDAFENFLCQISGKKQVIMFEPFNNSRLYEGHIQEAQLSYNHDTKTFHRSKLMDSTAMVMSPIDILEPDFKRFPLFADAVPLNCTIEEGDVLYMPSFWWHEVQSFPNTKLHRNMAVNFWYKPFLTKSFPCPECSLEVNQAYSHLLKQYHDLAK